MERNYYSATLNKPQHLSTGAVILNENGEVLCHHFEQYILDGQVFSDLYVLLRETPELGESLEQTITRGLKEEAGAEAKIETYIGSIKSKFPRDGGIMSKTTVYFLCKFKSMDESLRDPNDPEARSKLGFLPIDFLIEKMHQQYEKYGDVSFDESSILEEVKKYLKTNG